MFIVVECSPSVVGVNSTFNTPVAPGSIERGSSLATLSPVERNDTLLITSVAFPLFFML